MIDPVLAEGALSVGSGKGWVDWYVKPSRFIYQCEKNNFSDVLGESGEHYLAENPMSPELTDTEDCSCPSVTELAARPPRK